MPILTFVVLAFLLAVGGSVPAWADGSLPPLPYRYLHPPAALAATNQPPATDIHVLPVDYLRVLGFGTYTADTQAGLSGTKGAFRLHAGTTAIEIHITPVNPPPGLPAPLTVDGNAYQIVAREQPSGRDAVLVHPVNVILRWPHIPLAIYIHPPGGVWRQVCYEDTAVLTSTTIGCPIRTLGTVAAVAPGANTTITSPQTPVHGLNPYVPVLLAIVLLILAAALGYVVSRPRRGAKGGPAQ